MREQIFSGVLAPLLTPFADDGSVATELYVDHARRVLDEGCTGLLPFGTTSEANSLSSAERMAGLEALVNAGIDPGIIMAGTGLSALPETIALTRHAVSLGCGGVLLLPPYYYKGVSDDGLFATIEQVIEGVASDALRIYLYHIPPVAQVGYSTALLQRLQAAFPEIVVGTKDSSGDWDNTTATLQALPGFGTFVGSEVFLLDNMKGGGVGCITASANVNAGPIRALYDNWDADNAGALEREVKSFRGRLQEYPVIPAMKALLASRLGEPCWRNLRPPLLPLEASRLPDLLHALND
jgi:4-hydroxy-tetrahydrodipicolinate synthase